jgi:hypothetical protein
MNEKSTEMTDFKLSNLCFINNGTMILLLLIY